MGHAVQAPISSAGKETTALCVELGSPLQLAFRFSLPFFITAHQHHHPRVPTSSLLPVTASLISIEAFYHVYPQEKAGRGACRLALG